MKKVLFVFLAVVFLGTGFSNHASAVVSSTLSVHEVCVTPSDSVMNWEVTNASSTDITFRWESSGGHGTSVVSGNSTAHFVTATTSQVSLHWTEGEENVGVIGYDSELDCTPAPVEPVEPPATTTPPVVEPTPTVPIENTPAVLGWSSGRHDIQITSGSSTTTPTVSDLELRKSLIIQAIEVLNQIIAIFQSQQVKAPVIQGKG